MAEGETITLKRQEIAATALARLAEQGIEMTRDDLQAALLYLSQAITHASPALFSHYVGWRRALHAGHKVPEAELDAMLAALDAAIGHVLQSPAVTARALIAESRAQLAFMPDEPPSHLAGHGEAGALARRYLDSVLACRRQEATTLITDAADEGMPIRQIYLEVFQPVLREVGRLWQMNRVSVAQEHYVTAVTQAIMSQLYPRIFGGERRHRSIVACCVSGELHEIGVRMVADCFEMSGWDSHYLGANVPAQAVVDMAREVQAEIIAISATLTSHVGRVAEVIARSKETLGNRVSILVGGYPFNLDKGLWRRLGADGTAQNAADAVMLAERGGWR